MLLSYRNDVTPAKSAGVEFRSRARSIAVTLTYLITEIDETKKPMFAIETKQITVHETMIFTTKFNYSETKIT